MLKIIFIAISFLLALSIIIYKLIVSKLKRTEKTSLFVSSVTMQLFLYIILAVIYALFIPGIFNKLVLFILAIFPFVIGKFATYERENFYSYLQIAMIFAGILYVITH